MIINDAQRLLHAQRVSQIKNLHVQHPHAWTFDIDLDEDGNVVLNVKAGRSKEQLNIRTEGWEFDSIVSDIKRVTEAADRTQALQKKFKDYVDSLSTEERGILQGVLDEYDIERSRWNSSSHLC